MSEEIIREKKITQEKNIILMILKMILKILILILIIKKKFNKHGIDINGLDKDGYNINGVDKWCK